MSAIPKKFQSKVDALLLSIASSYNVTEDGRLSTRNPSIRLHEGALVQLLDAVPSRLPTVEFERCAKRAIFRAIKDRATAYVEFEKVLSGEIASFKRKKLSEYVLCSRCHFAVPPDYRLELALWDAKLTISSNPPNGLAAAQPSFRSGSVALAEPEHGAYLTMSVRARSKGGALERGTQDISFLLGLLNFTLNLGNLTWRWFSSEPQLRIRLFPGREVFLVDVNGLADVDVWRYYTIYPKSVSSLTEKELSKLGQYTKVIDRLGLLKRGDRDFYREFFELYFDALSELGVDNVVLRLWKAAEHITRAQSTSQIADRLSLTWADKKVVSAVCYALGHRRNWIMHNAKAAPQVEELTYIFQHFLENAAWKSLSQDVKSVAHWDAILKMSELDIDLDLAGEVVNTLKALR